MCVYAGFVFFGIWFMWIQYRDYKGLTDDIRPQQNQNIVPITGRRTKIKMNKREFGVTFMIGFTVGFCLAGILLTLSPLSLPVLEINIASGLISATVYLIYINSIISSGRVRG